MTRLIMQLLSIPEEVAKIVLGYIPVRRRRLTVSAPSYDLACALSLGNPTEFLQNRRANEGRIQRTMEPRYTQSWESVMEAFMRETRHCTWGYLQ